MSSTRREVLAAGAAGLAGMSVYGALAKEAHAAPEKEIAVRPAVIAIYLRGGQDALNALVPYDEGRYYDMRPNIAVPPPDKENGCLDLDGTFGLHPGLKGFKTLWDEKMLAPVVNAGVNSPSRSHFQMQDYMEQGRLRNSPVRSGWINRFLTTTSSGEHEAEFRALALQSRLPRSMRGKYPALAVAPSRARGRRNTDKDSDVLELFDKLYKKPPSMKGAGMKSDRADEDELTQNGRATIDALRKLEEILTQKPAGKEVRYPATGMATQLKMAARLLKSGQGVQAIALDRNGWDHHINEGSVGERDTINRMLMEVGNAVSTFYEDIQFMRKMVTTVIMTEFGRTNRENGNNGTDHGHGSVMWVIGGKVNGGKVYGDWTGLAPGKTYQNRDLLVTTDWRDVLSEVLYDHLRLHPSKKVFDKFTPREDKLGLFKT